jgi:hypothetical protein
VYGPVGAITLNRYPACNKRKTIKIQTSVVWALSRLKHGFESLRERQALRKVP